MSRVLLVAMGVPAFVAWPRHAGPGLRAAHFASVLHDDGHDVLVVAVLDATEPEPPPSTTIATVFVRERELFGDALSARLRAFAPEAVVGVTAYAASLAARLRLGVPLWADVFGDLMAEAQAKAARTGDDWSLVHFWTLLRGVLETADRFSAVSAAQASALVGQLGLAGRLVAATAGEKLVAVIPCAAAAAPHATPRSEARRALGLGADDFVLLVSGGVNTWCDVDTLAAGVVAAMREHRGVCVVTTGGAIPGHDESSHARLLRGLEAADRSRVRHLGWIDSSRLAAVYAACDLGLHVEQDLYERELGAENRVVEWLAHALVCATTALSETGRELVRAGLARPVAVGDAAGLARAILAAAGEREALAEAGRRGAAWAASTRAPALAAEPLRQWCAAPRRAGDAEAERLVKVGLLSHPERSVELLEAYVAALPLRELARRGLRWTWRRAVAACRRGSGGAVLLVAAAALQWQACASVGGAPQPDVLLVTVDTLRADRVGAFAADAAAATPQLDRVAVDGVVFELAMAASPDSEPALATLMTGVYPDRHGAWRPGGALDGARATLARRLKQAGYRTVGIAAAAAWRAMPGLESGFDLVDVASALPAEAEASDRRIAVRAAALLRAADGARPRFVWVHLAGAAAVDDLAGAVLAAAADGGRPTIAALVGVRGDGGDDRAEPGVPGPRLRDRALRVPWILAWPGVLEPAAVRDPACSVDVAPTLLHLAAVPVAAADFDGRALVGDLAAGDANGGPRPAGAFAPRAARASTPLPPLRDAGCFAVDPRAPHPFALRTTRYKMILEPGGASAGATDAGPDADRVQVFDLFEDPDETASVHVERTELVDDMLQPLAALRARFRANGRRW